LALLGTAEIHAAPVYDFSPVTQQIQALVQRESLSGASLIVIRNGTPIYEQYFGNYTTTTRIPIASASKWLSAIAMERLVEKQQMTWSDTVGQYFPTAPVDKQNITLGQLFSHTSGLPTTDAACIGDHSNYTLDSCAQQILAMTLEYQPGQGFAYGGNSMQVGGRMAEIASGKSWDQLFQDEVTTQLGMPNTDFAAGNLFSPPYVTIQNPQIAGGVRSTLGDYANVVQMIAQHGGWNGMAYLLADDVAEMQKDQTRGAPVIYTPDPLAYGYGYGEWRNLIDAQGTAVQVSSTGKFATSPWVDNETGVAAVFLVYSSYSLLANDLRDLWSNVRDVVRDPVFADGFEP
jgi:CubicO group peptidase (beta-lactamase class C family)